MISYAIYDVRSRDEAVEWTSRFMRLHRDLWPGWEGEAGSSRCGPKDSFESPRPRLPQRRAPRARRAVSSRTRDWIGTDDQRSRAVEAVWRIEAARLIAALSRITGDVGLAEEFAHDALVAALEQLAADRHPAESGGLVDDHRPQPCHRHVPATTRCTAARWRRSAGRATDRGPDRHRRRRPGRPRRRRLLGLLFTACHPVLPTDARVALTLRCVAGLRTDEIARAFLLTERAGRAAHLPGQEDVAGQERSDSRHRLAGRSIHGPAGRGARGDLPRLQRGILGDRRGRLDATGADPRGVAAGPAASPTWSPDRAEATRAAWR